MNERVCANCRAVVSGGPRHPCDKCGSLDGLDLALEFVKDEAALKAIRKAAEKVRAIPDSDMNGYFDAMQNLGFVVFEQTHPDKPGALPQAFAEMKQEGKDAV